MPLQALPPPDLRKAFFVCITCTLSLIVAMGVGRFAFTPLFPLMVQDALINTDQGSWIAASNYLGYLIGALLASRLRWPPKYLINIGLCTTVLVTTLMGWTSSDWLWHGLRFMAGVSSAWTLVGVSAWGLGWLANLRAPQLAGIIYAGVGIGIALVGGYCWIIATTDISSLGIWVHLGLLAGGVALAALWLLFSLGSVGASSTAAETTSPPRPAPAKRTRGLVICYTLFGFGYILPATYLPVLARQLIEDPGIFGLAWPIFGLAATLSTILAANYLKQFNRLNVWAAAHWIMAIGVLLPCFYPSLISVCVAALLVGGTFMVITMLGMQEAKASGGPQATRLLGRMSAGFGTGQLLGPILSAAIFWVTPEFTTALNVALTLAGTGLMTSAVYLRRAAKAM